MAKTLKMIDTDADGNFIFKLSNEAISGSQLLVQQVVMQLLTISGTNAYNPSYGSTFLNIIGTTYSEDNMFSIQTEIAFAVQNIKKIIKNNQSVQAAPGEKLVDLLISGFAFNKDLQRFEVALTIVSDLGEVTIPINTASIPTFTTGI